MTNYVECFRVGTRVKIADGVTGIIKAVTIRGRSNVAYDVVWWNGREQRTESFEPWQVEQTDDLAQARIGFVN